MPDSCDCKNTIDSNFVTAVQLLNSLGITYWACHGTLLGLVRDKELISFDHDIDFAVWKNSVDRDLILRQFQSQGFKLTQEFTEASLHFDRDGGRKVDINFYEAARDPDLACVLWRVPRQSFFARLLIGLIEENAIQSTAHALIRRIPFGRSIAQPIYNYCNKKGLLHHYQGYTNPCKYLQEFTFLKCHQYRCMIPVNAERILSFMYGPNWQTPLENYVWTKDSPAVITEETALS